MRLKVDRHTRAAIAHQRCVSLVYENASRGTARALYMEGA